MPPPQTQHVSPSHDAAKSKSKKRKRANLAKDIEGTEREVEKRAKVDASAVRDVNISTKDETSEKREISGVKNGGRTLAKNSQNEKLKRNKKNKGKRKSLGSNESAITNKNSEEGPKDTVASQNADSENAVDDIIIPDSQPSPTKDDVKAIQSEKKSKTSKNRKGLVATSPQDENTFIAENSTTKQQDGKVSQAIGFTKVRKHKTKDRKKEKKSNIQEADNAKVLGAKDGWDLSLPLGGQLASIEPLLSKDEKYLFLAYETTIRVYSTSTSLQVHSLLVAPDSLITGMAISPKNPEELYVTILAGAIELWNWKKKERVADWHTKHLISSLALLHSDSREGDEGLLYTLDQTSAGPSSITARRFTCAKHEQTQITKWESPKSPIANIKVIQGGRIIIYTTDNKIAIGRRTDQVTSISDLEYTWLEFSVSEPIVCLDVRQPESKTGATPKKSKQRFQPIDIAIGGAKGAIFVIEDILNRLIAFETQKNQSAIEPRRMHWHREAVLTVQWSNDGSYIISGGFESVIVLWQLATGHKQFLPHLLAPIENLKVSPSGSSYILRLGDNSAMILSTSELKPTAHVPGICPRVPSTRSKTIDQIKRVINAPTSAVDSKTPCAINPSSPTQILLATPDPTDISMSSLTSLQTVDLTTCSHLSRQALTRTNVTNFNIGPSQIRLSEPSVQHMQLTSDGKWLATTEEWMPSLHDIEPLGFNPADVLINQRRRKEVILRFWTADTASANATWALTNRVDSPHPTSRSDTTIPASIITLASNPSYPEFATLGEDLILRLWTPKQRIRSGLPVRGPQGQVLMNWQCRSSIPFDMAALARDIVSPFPKACVAYSADGSTIAVALACPESNANGTVHFIDTRIGNIRFSRTGLYQGIALHLGLLNRYLIVLSDSNLSVWDIVSEELSWGLNINSVYSVVQQIKEKNGGDNESITAETIILTTNFHGNTFAVALPYTHASLTTFKSGTSQAVAIFSPTSSTPQTIKTFHRPISALLASPNEDSYVIVSNSAEIYTLAPNAVARKKTIRQLPSPPASEAEAEETNIFLQNVYGSKMFPSTSLPIATAHQGDAMVVANDDDEDDGARVVRPEQLSRAFETGFSRSQLPSVRDMFERVVGLFAAKNPVNPV
ncbi:MAG: hypothetical protein M1834_007666 [Cirrosporium novae-zelandiae]|nr:MAG: hypothetical protein M1834_007666 [Cirrosporium novae-zelandiae]